MAPGFVDRMRGNKWNRALPGGGSKWLSAQPTCPEKRRP